MARRIRLAAFALLFSAVGCADDPSSRAPGSGGADAGGGGSTDPDVSSATSSNGGGDGGSSTGPQGSTSTSSGDPTGTTTGATSTGAGGAGGSSVVIAQGQVGRTMLSCDGGLTWVHDRSDDDDARCDRTDCDHHVGSAMGLVASGGAAVMTSGWGTPGRVRRSIDGATWEVTLEIDFPFGSLSEGNGVLLGATPQPWLSTDEGVTWESVPPIYLPPPLRHSIHIPSGGGRFVLTSEGDGLRVWLSDDAGTTFQESSPIPDGCLAISLTFGNDVLLMQHASSSAVCRSTDGGQTWAVAGIGGTIGLRTVDFTSGRFVALGEAGNGVLLYESRDGASWTSTPTDLPLAPWDITIGHDVQTGAFLAVSGAYESQRFFRSTDGHQWSESATSGQGHPIRRFVAAALEAPACP